MKNHDCEQIVQQVNLLIDGELNKKQEQEVLCELQRCMHCLDTFNMEKQFKEFLVNKIERKTAPSECLENIKKLIHQIKEEN